MLDHHHHLLSSQVAVVAATEEGSPRPRVQTKKAEDPMWAQFFKCFSLYTNIKQLVAPSRGGEGGGSCALARGHDRISRLQFVQSQNSQYSNIQPVQ
jgi:hypothetical protein